MFVVDLGLCAAAASDSATVRKRVLLREWGSVCASVGTLRGRCFMALHQRCGLRVLARALRGSPAVQLPAQ